ncbi:TPA: hypothetical protein P2I01_003686 [Aeromonas salmonicida]|nr:hypothetical protein [Aeromonas salmonicida]
MQVSNVRYNKTEDIVRAAIIVTGCFTLLIYILTFSIYPLSGEDYGLTKLFSNESVVDRLSWAATRSYQQIKGWNARFGEQMSIFLLSLPRPYFIFSAITSIVLFCTLCVNIFNQKNNDIFFSLSLSIVVIFLLMPGYEVFYWKTANAGYFLPMIITFIAIYPFCTKEVFQRAIDSNSRILASSVCALFAGLSFENVPVATFIFMFLVCLRYKSIKTKMMLIPACNIIGWTFLMLAPSTAKRAAYYRSDILVSGYSYDFIYSRFLDVISTFFETSSILLIVSMLSLVFLFINRKITSNIVFLVISSVLVVGSVVLSPYTEPRAFLYAWCCMIFVSYYAISVFVITTNKLRKAVLLMCAISLSFSLYTMDIVSSFSIASKNREQEILSLSKTSACSSGIPIEVIKIPSAYRYLNNRDGWLIGDLGFARIFYGCKFYVNKK